MKVVKLSGIAIVVMAGAFVAPTMSGASTPTGGKIDLWATANAGAKSKVVVIGAIADSGVGTSVDKNGKVDEDGNYERIVLKNGSFEADATTLNQKADAQAPAIYNTATCSFSASVSAPVTLFGGKGAYAGISGTLTLTEQFLGIMPRYKSGKNKGSCNQNSQPIAAAGGASAVGSVSFG